MPNPEQLLAVGAVAESALREAMPILSERIALSLPEIFGPAGKHTAQAFATAPGEASALENVVGRFHRTLTDFGLPESSTPSQLYKAVEEHGFDIQHTGKITRHFAGKDDIVFSDGSSMTRYAGAGRSGRTATTYFETPDKSASLIEDFSSFFGNRTHTIGFKTEHVNLKAAIERELLQK